MPLQDCELLPEDLEKLVKSYKAVVQLELGEGVPRGSKSTALGSRWCSLQFLDESACKDLQALGYPKIQTC